MLEVYRHPHVKGCTIQHSCAKGGAVKGGRALFCLGARIADTGA